jgi:hypothetical protein
MPDTLLPRPGSASPLSWIGDLTRVPYWVYRDGALPKVEQEQIFEGPVWNYLCLEDEIANPGDLAHDRCRADAGCGHPR